jgi:hypothetical protein
MPLERILNMRGYTSLGGVTKMLDDCSPESIERVAIDNCPLELKPTHYMVSETGPVTTITYCRKE